MSLVSGLIGERWGRVAQNRNADPIQEELPIRRTLKLQSILSQSKRGRTFWTKGRALEKVWGEMAGCITE